MEKKTILRSFLQSKKRKYMIFFSLAVVFLIIFSASLIIRNQAAIGQAASALKTEEKQGLWPWITSFSFQVLEKLAVAAVVALVTLGIIYGQKYRKLKSEVINKQVSEATLAQLYAWVGGMLNQGFKLNEVRENLITDGWPKEVVDKVVQKDVSEATEEEKPTEVFTRAMRR